MSPAIAVVQGCCQTIVAQSGTHSQFPRRTQRQPGSFYEHRFPLSCRTYFLLVGSGERAAVTLTRVAGYRRSPRGKTTTPNYSLKHARSGSDKETASTYPLLIRSRRAEPLLPYLEVIFMRFRGPQALNDKEGDEYLRTLLV